MTNLACRLCPSDRAPVTTTLAPFVSGAASLPTSLLGSTDSSSICAEVPGIVEAECYLVSQIGAPVDRPRITHLRVRCHDGVLSSEGEDRIRAVAERESAGINVLWKSFLTQTISVA